MLARRSAGIPPSLDGRSERRAGIDAKLDLNLLNVMVALLEAGSVTQAAVKLGMSQPSVSAALGRLREHFGDPLFVRAVGGMAPTPRGAEVASAARDILRQVDEQLSPEVHFDPARRHRPFTFAMSDVGEIVFLPRILHAVAAESPDTTVRSVNPRPAQLARAMEDGEIDLAVGYFPDLDRNAFMAQRLFRHRFVCLLRADHPVSGPTLSIGDFLALQHVVVRSEGRSQEIFESYLEANSLARRVAAYTPHFLSLLTLIASSDLVATVPHAIGIAFGKPVYGLKSMNPPFQSPTIDLHQHWHRKAHDDARNVWLRRIVGRLFNEHTDAW